MGTGTGSLRLVRATGTVRASAGWVLGAGANSWGES